ncbi:pilus assembly protein CpaE [Jannaschia faecimaris]|uniref:Pilus assembly protein CpaE n=1 Tax=Jannaschia faecimaris TaxID=1244108 RepID=A0A1H3L385_9RHOB|nr:AAA family ATPase [Jannaschia faecimaris]SDY58820.1 pilus assembly protein CpaE [Jannaschia faecimaris]
MASNLALLPEPEPLRAVTVSRDVQEFDLLIEDMEAELGEAWGDLDFVEAIAFLRQDEAAKLEFIVIAADVQDEPHLPQVADVIRQAKRAGLKVILVADGLGPMSLHELLRAGADDFAPYPLPEAALHDAVARLSAPGSRKGNADVFKRAGADAADVINAENVGNEAKLPARTTTGGGAHSEGAIFAVQSAAGGDGGTTLAVNLAWELANASKSDAPKVCVIDLGLQFGSVATYLDLPRKPMILEILSDVSSMDEQAFRQALRTYKDKVSVFTSPADILPLDLIGPEDVVGLLTLARSCFDIVIVDMPNTITGWTDTVLSQSDLYFVVCGMEVRSAQNALRFQKLLKSEGLPVERMTFVLNRGPGKMDMTGKARVKKMAEGLDVKFHAVLPDGGKQVTEINDQAAPLSTMAPRNALAKEIQKLAGSLLEAREAINTGAAPSSAKKPAKRAIFGLKFG